MLNNNGNNNWTTCTLHIGSIINILLSCPELLFFMSCLYLLVFLLNGAAAEHVADILSFVSVGHVVENARLVDVDGAATRLP
jgi:hypothetical protein